MSRKPPRCGRIRLGDSPTEVNQSTNFRVTVEIQVTRNTPPTFLVQAENDGVDSINNSLVYYIALKKAGVSAEMHSYAQGGHAFGLRRTKFPITRWPELVETWLSTIGMIPK
jgi:acetyl esterase/lipase